MIVSLLTVSTPAAPQTIIGVAKEWRVGFAFWLRGDNVATRLYQTLTGQTPPQAKPQEKQQDRDAKVSRIQIYPGDVTTPVDMPVHFAAVAYDRDDAPLGGIKISWSTNDQSDNHAIRISQRGEFESARPGVYKITAEGAGRNADVKVTVIDGPRRPKPDNNPANARPVSNRERPQRVGSLQTSKDNNGSKRVSSADFSQRQRAKGGRSGSSKPESSPKVASFSHERGGGTVAVMPQGGGSGGWDDSNYWSSSDPKNGVGDPTGAPLAGGAGSSNFQFAAPIYGSPGRGINISLGAAYNGRLWNKAGSQITYDIDRGWPAPGWSLGFGKILWMGSNGAMMVDADGTRHSYSGTVWYYPYPNQTTYFSLHTTDGTFTDYGGVFWGGGNYGSASATLANGTTISYNINGPGAVYPTQIIDPNGNYTTITYVNNAGPRIQTITDTLGRVIQFYYDSSNLLTAITGPGLNNTTRTLVRFHYHQISLTSGSYSFSNLTPVVRDSYPWVVDAIYYPPTGTGYWFGDSDSYSSYGMLAKVAEQRNMTFSASSLNDMGTVGQGSLARKEVYNYPLYVNDQSGTQSSNLSDAPTYSSMTETWTRDGTNTDQTVTLYDVNENASPRTVTITLPNGTKSTQYSYNYTSLPDTDPLKALDGLVYRDETYVTSNNILQSSTATWEKGAYDSPRPTRVEATNERQQTTATEFSYGTVYNQVTEIRNKGYSNELLRATRTTYQNSSNYTNRHIFNLPLTVEVYAGDNTTRVSHTDYQYDGQTLTPATGVTMHLDTYDPYTTDNTSYCCDWEWDESHEYQYCAQYCFQSAYDPNTDYRGNVTQVTTYADAINLAGAVTETRRYDITGNLVKASTSCCQQTSFNYTIDTQFAYPLSKTRGSATDAYAQITTSATYDFNTGLVLSATDANGRASTTTYSSATLRPQSVTLPTNGHTDFVYDDTAMTVTVTTYLAASEGGGIADQNIKLLNGLGQVRQEKARAPDNGPNQVWDLVDTAFNNMAQVSQQTRPYRSGDTLQSTTVAYDAFGRTMIVTAPDGSTTQTFYNETSRPDVASTAAGETTRVQDAWGRERWGRTDAQGRLVEVVEPNPSGNGSVATGGLVTTYTYNTLGNLVTVNQGAQTRSFKYDSLGRLTAQKLAETSTTLNDSGTYVGSGTWSDVFTYDDHSNLTSRTDARGVKSVYNYLVGGNLDPLNRLQSVSWDTSGFGDTANPILSAATVSYSYRQKGSTSDLKDVTQLAVVTAGTVSSETYGYDSEGRVITKGLTVNGRPSMDTDYAYDTLDRIKDVTYPKRELSVSGSPRKVVHHDYDIASRLSSLTVDGQSYASNFVYNAASQTTSLNVGVSGSNQIIESYNYDAQTGLLASQTVARSSAPTSYLLNLAYDYTNASGKRTGQLTRVLNNLNHNKDRSYSYDALGRLTQAKGGVNGTLWTQSYAYDRYGNRTGVSSSGYSAKTGSAGVPPASAAQREGTGGSSPTVREGAVATGSSAISVPADPKVDLPTDLLARNNSFELPEALRDNNSRAVSDSPMGLYSSARTAKTGTSSPPQGPTNLALNKPATESSTFNGDRYASKAVDGNTDGALWNGSASATNYEYQPWWQVDLQSVQTIGSIEVWGRTDCCPEMTSNFYVLVSDQPFASNDLATARAQAGVSSYYVPGYSGTPGTINVNRTGRYVRVQLAASQYLVLAEVKVFQATNSTPIPTDGIGTLAYDTSTNRITTSGFAYDAAGNQTRALAPYGGSQKFQYDAANRVVNVKTDTNQVIATYTYGDDNQRLIADESGMRTYYADDLAEYIESGGSTTPTWSKSYIYLGDRLLATLEPNGSGGEYIQYHHPDRLGTRLVTNAQDTTYFEQQTLPFGTSLNESPNSGATTGATNRRFTSYNRSVTTGLDYANNRHYDSQQGRFTQVDPIGMSSSSLENPQTLNLYSYCGNDPINQIDPDGLFWGKLFKWLGKALKIIGIVSLVVITILFTGIPVPALLFKAALWTFTNILLPLANVLAHVPGLGGVVFTGAPGSPPWNPKSSSVFGNSFQDQDKIYTCHHPPDCQDEIPTLSFSVPDIIGHRSFWEKLDNALDKGLTIVVGFAGTITFGGSKWASKKFATVLGGQAAAREWERDNSVREGSWFHTGGAAVGYVWDLATGEEIAAGVTKALGWSGKLAIHAGLHPFRFGKFTHLQLNLWRAGVKGSGIVFRIPLFLKRWPVRDIVIRQF